MAKSYQVLAMLIPNGGYVQVGEDYEGIEFLECDPIAKEEFEAGFAKYDAWEKQQKEIEAQKKNAALSKLQDLGLDVDDLKALGLG